MASTNSSYKLTRHNCFKITVALQLLLMIGGLVTLSYGVSLNSSGMIVLGQFLAVIPFLSLCLSYCMTNYSVFREQEINTIVVINPIDIGDPTSDAAKESLAGCPKEGNPINMV